MMLGSFFDCRGVGSVFGIFGVVFFAGLPGGANPGAVGWGKPRGGFFGSAFCFLYCGGLGLLGCSVRGYVVMFCF